MKTKITKSRAHRASLLHQLGGAQTGGEPLIGRRLPPLHHLLSLGRRPSLRYQLPVLNLIESRAFNVDGKQVIFRLFRLPLVAVAGPGQLSIGSHHRRRRLQRPPGDRIRELRGCII